MCLYPKLVKNPKYKPNRKNGGRPPKCEDERCMYVPIGCGKCIECRKKKSREWQVRLNEELRTDNKAKFVTLTFAPEELEKLCKEVNQQECNAVATIAVRRFLERWRKSEKKSVKHWLITEMGHDNTKRIHLHGLIWTDKDNNFISEKWKYGNIWVGEYVNSRTINYIVKYVTKIDTDNMGFQGVIMCSAGLGKGYTNRYDFQKNKYIPNNTNETYRLPNGNRTALPIYYRNKRYSEKERELLWIEKLNKQERYVLGTRISVKENEEEYFAVLKNARKYNKRLGYGTDEKIWDKKTYNITLNMLRKKKMEADYRANNADWQKYLKKRLKNLEKQNSKI